MSLVVANGTVPKTSNGLRDQRKPRADQVHWDLSMLYSHDPRAGLARDLGTARRQVEAFVRRYSGKVGSLSAVELCKAIQRLETIFDRMGRPNTYVFLEASTNLLDPARAALEQRVQDELTPLESALFFFEAEWMELSEDSVEALLDRAELANYRHYLKSLRRYRPYLLSQAEDRLLNDKSVTGREAWERLFKESLARAVVRLESITCSFSEAQVKLRSPVRAMRRRAFKAMARALRKEMPLRAFILNTVLNDAASDDRLHRYPTWRTGRNLQNDVSDLVVDNLMAQVDRRRDIPHRYYRLKRKLLGLPFLEDWDRGAPVFGAEPTVGWGDAQDVILDAYGAFSTTLRQCAAQFFDSGWIDAAPNRRKPRWTFAYPATRSLHPFVLVNFHGKRTHLVELAHELGHGVHLAMSRCQTPLNFEPSLIVAETAATLSETLVFRHLLDKARTPAKRLVVLLGHIEQLLALIFRRMAMLRFEDTVHAHRRQRGELSQEELAAYWLATERRLYGPAVRVGPDHGAAWSAIVQFVTEPAYGYAYAAGNLVALALYSRWVCDREAVAPRYLDVLSAGGSESPSVLLAGLGVHLEDPACWQTGLDKASQFIDEAEVLVQALETGRRSSGQLASRQPGSRADRCS